MIHIFTDNESCSRSLRPIRLKSTLCQGEVNEIRRTLFLAWPHDTTVWATVMQDGQFMAKVMDRFPVIVNNNSKG